MRPLQLPIVATVLSLLLVAACTEKFTPNLRSATPQLVVDGWITPQTGPYQVRLSLSGAFTEVPSVVPVSDAQVWIKDSKGNTDTLYYKQLGLYQTRTTKQGQPGTTYTLTVVYKSVTYTASELLKPLNTKIDSLTQVHKFSPGGKDEDYRIIFHGQDPNAAGNYYRWIFVNNDTVLNQTADEIVLARNKFVQGNYINFEFGLRFRQGDHVTVNMLSLSETAYTYLTQLRILGIANGGPFAPIPANPLTNVKASNGSQPLGYFGASDLAKDSLVVQTSP